MRRAYRAAAAPASCGPASSFAVSWEGGSTRSIAGLSEPETWEAEASVSVGSKARGDDHPSSDIDVIVVLREPVAENAKATVSAAAYDVLEKSGVYISTVVVSDREFERPTGQLRWRDRTKP